MTNSTRKNNLKLASGHGADSVPRKRHFNWLRGKRTNGPQFRTTLTSPKLEVEKILEGGKVVRAEEKEREGEKKTTTATPNKEKTRCFKGRLRRGREHNK